MAGERPRFLTAEWRDLVVLNYEVDATILAKRVPPGTEVDLWNGRAFVSVVGFRFLRTRVFGVPIPFHRHFEEVNLRFYVRRSAPEGRRRGVVFVKEIVPRMAIAWVARRLYNENYIALPMRHEVVTPTANVPSGRAMYEWRFLGRWNRIMVEADGAPSLPAPGSEEEFITEHHWGYALQRDNGCVEYRVEHPQWRVWRASSAGLDCSATDLYGPEFSQCLSGSPSSAFMAEGSPVVVHRGTRLPLSFAPFNEPLERTGG